MAATASRLHPGSGALSTPRNTAGRSLPSLGASGGVSGSPTPSVASAGNSGAIVLLDQAAKQRLDAALWSAAASGNTPLVTRMLQAGASGDAERDGFPAVCVATVGGHTECVMALVTAGADPNSTVQAVGPVFGATSMYLAAHSGHGNIARILIDASCDIEIPLPANNCSPLYMAAETGHAEIVRSLIAAGAELNRRNAGGASAACIAAKNGRTEALAVLAKAGADLDTTMDNGTAPAHLAAMAGQSEALVALHTLGADMNKITVVGGHEKSPLALAAHYGHTNAVGSLRECLSVRWNSL